jgi:hypothetical protein
MNQQSSKKFTGIFFFAFAILGLMSPAVFAQPDRQTSSPPTPQQAAPFDMTGYWVSVVTEDWRWRMLVPPEGDAGSIPLNQAGEELANAWRADDSELETCLAFGGASIMRYPGRLHISWDDEQTLRIDFSAGNQSRLLHFGGDASTQMNASLQGYTTASWYKERQTRGLGFGGPVRSFEGGNLHSSTSHLSAAYLQRNGIPYSDQTSINDFYRVVELPNNERWLIVTSIITDPVYLREEIIWSTNFKYEPNGDNWEPGACR